MGSALICSFVFLCSYLYYHFTIAGVTKYQREGILRFVYYLF